MGDASPYLHPVSDRRTLLAGPNGAILLLAGQTANDQLSVLEHPLAPRALGAPVHLHRSVDEYSIILEGVVGAEVDGVEVLARPGDVLHKPRGVSHAFWNPTDEPARLLEIIVPGGFESYFSELSDILSAGGPPSPQALGALGEKYATEFDLSSIPRIGAQHGLHLD